MTFRRPILLAAVACAVACGLAAAVRAADAPPPLPSTPDAVTRHAVSVEGRTLRYSATAGRTVLYDAKNEPAASLFSVAYTLDGAREASRPVAFLWNGGPGSSSLWLHLGAFAPLVVRGNGTSPVALPASLVPNDGTLLDATDLVFVDAPGTGFSRIGGKGKPADFYGVDQDARAFTQFIERWLSAHDRWGSPKFLIGESYGTTRAANVVDYDIDRTSDSPAYDPTLDASIQSAFVSAFNRYVREDLRYRSDLRYLPFNYGEVGNAWSFKRDAGDVGIGVQVPDVIPDLAQALTRNPGLRVFSANGYYDLATPFFGTELDLAHLGIDPALRGHVSYGYYRSGHMIYLDPAARRSLRADLESWMRATLAGR